MKYDILPFEKRHEGIKERYNYSETEYSVILAEGIRLTKSSKFYLYENHIYVHTNNWSETRITVPYLVKDYNRLVKKFKEKLKIDEYDLPTTIEQFIPQEGKKHQLITYDRVELNLTNFSLIKIIPGIEISYDCIGASDTFLAGEIRYDTMERPPLASTLYLNDKEVKVKSHIQRLYGREEKFYSIDMVISVNLKDLDPIEKQENTKYSLLDI